MTTVFARRETDRLAFTVFVFANQEAPMSDDELGADPQVYGGPSLAGVGWWINMGEGQALVQAQPERMAVLANK